jgi:hypothetical protein
MAGLDVLQSMFNPSYQADQATIDRQAAMANALMQQSLTPEQGQMVSGHYIPPALGGINRLISGIASAKLADKANADRTQLGQRYAAALQNALGSSSPTGQDQSQPQQPNIDPNAAMTAPPGQLINSMMPQTQQPQTQPQFSNQPQGNNFALNNLIRGSVIGQLGGDQAAGAYWKQYDPTDATKMAMAAGADPRLANQQALQKANYIAPISMRQGAALIDPVTNQITNFSPKMPDSSMPIIENGKIVGVRPLTGAQDISQNNARAAAAGAAGYPAAVNVQAGQGGVSQLPPGVPTSFTPTSKAAIEAFGSGQTQQLATLDQNWKTLSEQNRQAQTTNSYLQNIKELAKTAATGPGADKKDFVNGLLSVAGISDKATNAVTANDLLDKYQGQIIARLGQGGMGTDAARSLLASAYPGAHMNQGAINEAVDNLVGANNMVKAKAALLSNDASRRDPVAYQQKEIIFDQNADPRLWQYKSMAGTPQGKQFLQSVLQQDPQFLQKAQALHQIGAF